MDIATAAGLSAVNGGHHYYYYYYLLLARSDGDGDGDEEEDKRRKSSGSGVDAVAVPGEGGECKGENGRYRMGTGYPRQPRLHYSTRTECSVPSLCAATPSLCRVDGY